MFVSLAACSDSNTDSQNDKNGSQGNDTYPAGIEAANYQMDFNIYPPDWGMYQRYFFADDAGTDVMTKALYDRELSVEEHLGVNTWIYNQR